MEIIDSATVTTIRRRSGSCGWCQRSTDLQMHHVRGRWQQLDTPWNLICLCLACHMKNHNGQAPRPAQVLKKVAERMSKQLGVKVTPAAIQSVANLFRLMSVKDSDETNLGKIRKLSGAARQLGMASWLRYLALRERR